MDTSFLSAGPVTWPVLFAFAVFVMGLGKLADWATSKLKAGQSAVVSPLQVDITAAKLRIEVLAGELNAFKIEVARTYVTGDAIHRLERRIDDMLESVRGDMKETREIVLKAITGRPPG